jgi:hypothetical protein
MKRKLAVAACVAAGCIATANSHAATKRYMCSFKADTAPVVIAMSGPKAKSLYCPAAKLYLHGWHRVSNHIQISSGKHCVWMTPNALNFVVAAGTPGTPNYLVNYLCRMVNQSFINLGFERLQ